MVRLVRWVKWRSPSDLCWTRWPTRRTALMCQYMCVCGGEDEECDSTSLTCTNTALMSALPIKVAKKNVLNGTNKWPAVRPARSNSGLGTEANNKMPKNPKRPKLLTTNWGPQLLLRACVHPRSYCANYLLQAGHDPIAFLFFVQQIDFALF